MDKPDFSVRRFLTVALWIWLSLGAVAQGTFVMPGTAATAFGGTGAYVFTQIGWRYQEVFGSYDMQMPFGVFYITGVRFRVPPTGSSFEATLPEIEVRISTTSRAVDRLDDFYARNIGPDEVVVHPKGPLHVGAAFVPGVTVQPFDIEIPFSTPFAYDRSRGHLLLDIVNYGGASKGFSPEEILNQPGLPDSVSVVQGPDMTHGSVFTQGMVAQFEYRPIPEPSLMWLLALGACGWLMVTRVFGSRN